MFKRIINELVLSEGSCFKIIALLGPRQSGKTTLLRLLFPHYQYISLESPDILEHVMSDPRGFFQDKKKSWIIDEAQNYPELFSYLQEFADCPTRTGKFILSGSQNFLLHKKISQSLAGRIALYYLLPICYQEYTSNSHVPDISIWEFLYKGQYPRPYHENLPIKKWWESYLQTYLEKDLRSLENIRDLSKFRLFIKLCAGYHGQQINAQQISVDCGVSQTTIHHWLSLLEASFIIYRLPPYYKNYTKRLVKTPKLYFYDSGLVCYLLGIQSAEHLHQHVQRGAIFEGFIISEILKIQKSLGKEKDIYYWRTQQGQEIDLLIDDQPIKLVEIKSGATFQTSFIEPILNWQLISEDNATAQLIYTGDDNFTFKNIPILNWKKVYELINDSVDRSKK